MTSQEKLIRVKIFSRFFRYSPKELAKHIQKVTGIPTTGGQVAQVIRGTQKSSWIREGLSNLLNEPLDQLWSDGYRKHGSGRRRKAA